MAENVYGDAKEGVIKPLHRTPYTLLGKLPGRTIRQISTRYALRGMKSQHSTESAGQRFME
eukprot:2158206-Rhodomonas_salina.9